MHYLYICLGRQETQAEAAPLKVPISSEQEDLLCRRNTGVNWGRLNLVSVIDRRGSADQVPWLLSVLLFFSWVLQILESELLFSFFFSWPPVPKIMVPKCQCKDSVNNSYLLNYQNHLYTLPRRFWACSWGGVTSLCDLPEGSHPQSLIHGGKMSQSHFLLRHCTDHSGVRWVHDQTLQSKPQWHAMPTIFRPSWEKQLREKNIQMELLSPHA